MGRGSGRRKREDNLGGIVEKWRRRIILGILVGCGEGILVWKGSWYRRDVGIGDCIGGS